LVAAVQVFSGSRVLLAQVVIPILAVVVVVVQDQQVEGLVVLAVLV
jgi:hypothetical protein